MRILVIGGTRFVGLAIVRSLLASGHDVTVFHRGQSQAPGIEGATSLLGDRDADLSALGEGEWDATIDVCAYRPRQVDSLADALGGRGGRHVFISTVSVYADDIPFGSDESARLADTSILADVETDTCDIDGATYGPLKVLCEERVRARYSDPIIIRPTYVIGPDDYTMRFPAWVERIAAGGVVEAPEPRSGALQYVDVRDLAYFVVSVTERGAGGTWHTAAESITFEAMLDAVAGAVGGDGLEIAWVEPESLEVGLERFPLWSGPSSEPVLAVDPSAAERAGLRCRPLADSSADTARWLAEAASA